MILDEDSTPGPEFQCGCDVNIDKCKPGDVIFIGDSFEKGEFFSGDIHLVSPFDIKNSNFAMKMDTDEKS